MRFLIVRAADQGEMRTDAHFRLYDAWMHLRADPQITRFNNSTIRKHPTEVSRQFITTLFPDTAEIASTIFRLILNLKIDLRFS